LSTTYSAVTFSTFAILLLGVFLYLILMSIVCGCILYSFICDDLHAMISIIFRLWDGGFWGFGFLGGT
jgi:hypothetical protein